MTWKEFKEEVERQGVADDFNINYIDISCRYDFDDLPEIHVTIEDGHFSIL